MVKRVARIIAGLLMGLAISVRPGLAQAEALLPLRPVATCPASFEPLTQRMLSDLPDYINRVLARSWRTAGGIQTHVVLASPATYPEAVPEGHWSSPTPAQLEANQVKQLFFTTLERQYLGSGSSRANSPRLRQLQHYHWALLTETKDGWQLAGLFSRLAGYPAEGPPSPFNDSTYGDVGRAITLWLRDCKAGAIE